MATWPLLHTTTVIQSGKPRHVCVCVCVCVRVCVCVCVRAGGARAQVSVRPQVVANVFLPPAPPTRYHLPLPRWPTLSPSVSSCRLPIWATLRGSSPWCSPSLPRASAVTAYTSRSFDHVSTTSLGLSTLSLLASTYRLSLCILGAVPAWRIACFAVHAWLCGVFPKFPRAVVRPPPSPPNPTRRSHTPTRLPCPYLSPIDVRRWQLPHA